MEELREKFLANNIPYDDLDVEMIEMINVLNFKLGLKTQFCCYGHKERARFYVIFDESVTDEQIYSLAEKVAVDWKSRIFFYKWVRGVNGRLQSNWKLQSSLGFLDPNSPEKKQHLDEMVKTLIHSN